MAKPFYLICAKCGSDRVLFDIKEPTEEDCGVRVACTDCGELTGVEEHNERMKKRSS